MCNNFLCRNNMCIIEIFPRRKVMSDDNNLTEAETRALLEAKAEIEARDLAKGRSNAADVDFSGASVKLNESLSALKKVSALVSAILAESEAAESEAKANADRFFAKSALKEAANIYQEQLARANLDNRPDAPSQITRTYYKAEEKENTAFRVWAIADELLKKVKGDLEICWNDILDSEWIVRSITDAKNAREYWEIAKINAIEARRGLIEANEHLGAYEDGQRVEAIERARDVSDR